MDIGSLFLILAVAILVVLFLTRPFMEPNKDQRLLVPAEVQQREHHRSALLAERDRVLNALLELDSDNELGKLLPDDYTTQRERLVLTGAEVLKQLDAINLQNEPDTPRVAPSPAEEDELEALIAARRQAKEQKKNYCPACGSELKPGDRFCPGCGARVEG